MKALKWELVRKLTVSITSGSASTSFERSSATSLATSESSTPRVALNWKLRDGVTLRRSSTSTLPTKSDSKAAAAAKQRPHAQSEPAMPLKQVLTKPESTKLKPPGPEAERSDVRFDAKTEENAQPLRGSKPPNNNNEEKVRVIAERAATVDTTTLQPMTAPSSASSSENESKSKLPAISRKKSTTGPQLAAQRLENEAKPSSTSGRISDTNSGNEPESGDNVTRAAEKQGRAAAANHSRQSGDESEGKEDDESGSESDSQSRNKVTKRDEQEPRDESERVLSFSDDEEETEASR